MRTEGQGVVTKGPKMGGVVAFVAGVLVLASSAASSQPSQEGFGFKVYRADTAFHPFVQVYLRTFDQEMQPLVNLNERNIGVMVDGRGYDPAKAYYRIESIRTRGEAIRSILVIDASGTMAGPPFERALRAAARYIDSKRPQDQIAILAIRDTKTGHELVSNFDNDPGALGRRLAEIRPDGKKTRLYDAMAEAMKMAAAPSQGGEPIVSTSIVVFSDGKDEGSALTREDLMTRISTLEIPVPIYSIAYSKLSPDFFRNLEALSKNSFGVYYVVGEAVEKMQRIVEEIQNILQSDYVITFRTCVAPDGKEHPFKIGVEYPSGSKVVTYQSGNFEAVQVPIDSLREVIARLEVTMPQNGPCDPYIATGPVMGPPAGS